MNQTINQRKKLNLVSGTYIRKPEIDEHERHWHDEEPSTFLSEKVILIIFALASAALIYTHSEAASAVINCMSLVDANGEE